MFSGTCFKEGNQFSISYLLLCNTAWNWVPGGRGCDSWPGASHPRMMFPCFVHILFIAIFVSAISTKKTWQGSRHEGRKEEWEVLP